MLSLVLAADVLTGDLCNARLQNQFSELCDLEADPYNLQPVINNIVNHLAIFFHIIFLKISIKQFLLGTAF
jgi:hypothetical protein